MQAVIEISCPTVSHLAAGYHAQDCHVQHASMSQKLGGAFILTVIQMTTVGGQDMTLPFGLQPRTGPPCPTCQHPSECSPGVWPAPGPFVYTGSRWSPCRTGGRGVRTFRPAATHRASMSSMPESLRFLSRALASRRDSPEARPSYAGDAMALSSTLKRTDPSCGLQQCWGVKGRCSFTAQFSLHTAVQLNVELQTPRAIRMSETLGSGRVDARK